MSDISTLQKLDAMAQAIYDKKGFNILALDVRRLSSLTDYCIIAEGNIDRHLRSIASFIREKLGELGYHPHYVEGLKSGAWIVMDYGDVFIHLMTFEEREKFALEELWRQSEIVDVKIIVEAVK